MSGLSVVIPSKSVGNLERCMAAVRQHEPSVRIIVIDDGIETMEFCPYCRRDVRDSYCGPCDMEIRDTFMEGVKPFIFSRNVNLGIQAAGSDDVIVLNDDALLQSPSGFRLMQEAAEDYPEFGIIGATTNVTGQPLQYRQKIGLRAVPHFAFVCVLIPRRTIERVGLMDERYCIDYGCDDLDYCEAVTRAGLKVGVHDHCYVDHGSLTSSFRGDPRMPKSFAQNYGLFKQKWGIA